MIKKVNVGIFEPNQDVTLQAGTDINLSILEKEAPNELLFALMNWASEHCDKELFVCTSRHELTGQTLPDEILFTQKGDSVYVENDGHIYEITLNIKEVIPPIATLL